MNIFLKNNNLDFWNLNNLAFEIGILNMLYEKELITKEELDLLINSIIENYNDKLYNSIKSNFSNEKDNLSKENEDE